MLLEISWPDGNETVELRYEPEPRTLLIGGKAVHCEWERLPDGGYLLLMSGHVFDLRVDLDSDPCIVTGRPGRFRLRMHDPRRLSLRDDLGENRKGVQRLTAEMPGKVMRLLVKPGDKVVFEQGLLVLEAMKMQNEIRAPQAGLVRDVGVSEGCVVAAGDFLVSLE